MDIEGSLFAISVDVFSGSPVGRSSAISEGRLKAAGMSRAYVLCVSNAWRTKGQGLV